MLDEAFAAIEDEAASPFGDRRGARVTVTRLADIRYAGQAYELTVPVAPGPVDVGRLVQDFVAEHDRTYGHGSADDPVDIVSIRAVAHVERTASRRYDPLAAIRSLAPHESTRDAYFGPEHGTVETPVCTRAGLLAGARRGPLIVEEFDSTCVVPPGCARGSTPRQHRDRRR